MKRPARQPLAGSPARPASPSILAIDDSPDNLALLADILEDYPLRMADSGPGGLELARAEQPELILLDVQMPGMDGFAVLESLRADERTRRIPVVLLTAAYGDPASIARGFALGAIEYLTKPILAEELRVRVAAVLRAVRAERELARLRRDFAAMLLHDLRTPLEAVRLAVGLLARDQDARRRADLAALAQAGLADMIDLAEGLIDGYRLDEGELQLDRRDFGLAEVVTELWDRLEPLARQRPMALVPTIPAGLTVHADERVVRRVLANLLSNALKHADPGPLRIGATRTAQGVEVRVEDSGPGMPPDVMARAFDRYFHQQRRRERHQGGFGLGLAFCRQAVEAHGGRIGVERGESGGTRFWFTLPS